MNHNVGKKRLGRLTIQTGAPARRTETRGKCQLQAHSVNDKKNPVEALKQDDNSSIDLSFGSSFVNDLENDTNLVSALDQIEQDFKSNDNTATDSINAGRVLNNKENKRGNRSNDQIAAALRNNSAIVPTASGPTSTRSSRITNNVNVIAKHKGNGTVNQSTPARASGQADSNSIESFHDLSFASPIDISTPQIFKNVQRPKTKATDPNVSQVAKDKLSNKSITCITPCRISNSKTGTHIKTPQSTPRRGKQVLQKGAKKRVLDGLENIVNENHPSTSAKAANPTTIHGSNNQSDFFRSLLIDSNDTLDESRHTISTKSKVDSRSHQSNIEERIPNLPAPKSPVLNLEARINIDNQTSRLGDVENKQANKSNCVGHSAMNTVAAVTEDRDVDTNARKGTAANTNIISTPVVATGTIQLALDCDQLALSSWGLPDTVLKQYKSRGITHMFQWQAECLLLGNVLNSGNLVYSAPTSAGKTMVAELLVLKRVMETRKKAIIILPFVSVTREKMFYLQELYQDAGIRVSGFMGHYAPAGGFNSVDVAVCTIEKGNSLVNRLLQENKLDQLGIIVVDELHLIGDPHRGYLLELLLTKVQYMSTKAATANQQSTADISIQVVGMSATLPNLDLLARWLHADLYRTDYRPVPLSECVKIGTQVYDSSMQPVRNVDVKYAVTGDDEHVVPLCLETLTDGHSVLIFCPTKNWCERLAETVARELYNLLKNPEVAIAKTAASAPSFVKASDLLVLPLDEKSLQDTLEQLQRSPTGLDQVLGRTVRYGVAYHHAGLTFDERDIVEGAFRQGILKVLVATSTLSSGVNLPARRVLVRTPVFHAGQLIDFLTYKQMIGRAGRMGVDTAGESILICKANERSKAEKLVKGSLPPVHSTLIRNQGESLSSSIKRAILEVVVSGVAATLDEVSSYAGCTMLATSAAEGQAQTQDLIHRCIHFLQENEFICIQNITDKNGVSSERFVASQLGSAVLSSSISPDEGLVVFSELQKARQCFVLENELHIVYQVTPIYAQIDSIDWFQFFGIWESLSTGMRKVAELVGVQESFFARAISGRIPKKTDAQLRTLAIHKRFYTALVLHELVQEVPLYEVCRKYNCNKGQLQSLQQSAATFAGMVTVFCARLGWSNLELIFGQFQSRLTFGVQRELCDLVRISALNGQRARVMYNGGYQTVAALASAQSVDVEALLKNSAPFQSNKKQGKETDWELTERRKARCIFLTGRKGVTEYEAAEIIISEAKGIIQEELGGLGVQWASNPPQTPRLKSPVLLSPLSNNNRASTNRGKRKRSCEPNTVEGNNPVKPTVLCVVSPGTLPRTTVVPISASSNAPTKASVISETRTCAPTTSTSVSTDAQKQSSATAKVASVISNHAASVSSASYTSFSSANVTDISCATSKTSVIAKTTTVTSTKPMTLPSTKSVKVPSTKLVNLPATKPVIVPSTKSITFSSTKSMTVSSTKSTTVSSTVCIPIAPTTTQSPTSISPSLLTKTPSVSSLRKSDYKVSTVGTARPKLNLRQSNKQNIEVIEIVDDLPQANEAVTAQNVVSTRKAPPRCYGLKTNLIDSAADVNALHSSHQDDGNSSETDNIQSMEVTFSSALEELGMSNSERIVHTDGAETGVNVLEHQPRMTEHPPRVMGRLPRVTDNQARVSIQIAAVKQSETNAVEQPEIKTKSSSYETGINGLSASKQTANKKNLEEMDMNIVLDSQFTDSFAFDTQVANSMEKMAQNIIEKKKDSESNIQQRQKSETNVGYSEVLFSEEIDRSHVSFNGHLDVNNVSDNMNIDGKAQLGVDIDINNVAKIVKEDRPAEVPMNITGFEFSENIEVTHNALDLNISHNSCEVQATHNAMDLNISHNSNEDLFNDSVGLIAASDYERVGISGNEAGENGPRSEFCVESQSHIPYQSGQEACFERADPKHSSGGNGVKQTVAVCAPVIGELKGDKTDNDKSNKKSKMPVNMLAGVSNKTSVPTIPVLGQFSTQKCVGSSNRTAGQENENTHEDLAIALAMAESFSSTFSAPTQPVNGESRPSESTSETRPSGVNNKHTSGHGVGQSPLDEFGDSLTMSMMEEMIPSGSNSLSDDQKALNGETCHKTAQNCNIPSSCTERCRKTNESKGGTKNESFVTPRRKPLKRAAKGTPIENVAKVIKTKDATYQTPICKSKPIFTHAESSKPKKVNEDQNHRKSAETAGKNLGRKYDTLKSISVEHLKASENEGVIGPVESASETSPGSDYIPPTPPDENTTCVGLTGRNGGTPTRTPLCRNLSTAAFSPRLKNCVKNIGNKISKEKTAEKSNTNCKSSSKQKENFDNKVYKENTAEKSSADCKSSLKQKENKENDMEQAGVTPSDAKQYELRRSKRTASNTSINKHVEHEKRQKVKGETEVKVHVEDNSHAGKCKNNSANNRSARKSNSNTGAGLNKSNSSGKKNSIGDVNRINNTSGNLQRDRSKEQTRQTCVQGLNKPSITKRQNSTIENSLKSDEAIKNQINSSALNKVSQITVSAQGSEYIEAKIMNDSKILEAVCVVENADGEGMNSVAEVGDVESGDDADADKLSPSFIDPDTSGISQTQQSFSIIDVCGDKRLFKTFIMEWRTKSRYTVSLACEKLQNELPTAGIGSNFRKEGTPSKRPVVQQEDLGIVLENQGVCIVGLAVSWEHRDAYYIALTNQQPQGDPDDSLAAPLSDVDISINIRVKAIKSVLQQTMCKSDPVTVTMFDIKSHYRAFAEGCGFCPKGEFMDPKIACWMLDPGAAEKNLHRMVTNLLPLEVHMLHGVGGGIGVGSLGMSPQNPGSGRYRACTEAVLVRHLGEYFTACLEKEGTYSSFRDVEMSAAIALCRMELNGFGFSTDECEAQKEVMISKLSALEQMAYNLAGHVFTLSATDDVAQVLFIELRLPPNGDPTAAQPLLPGPGRRGPRRGQAKPRYSTSKEILEKLEKLHALPGIILEWRRITNALTKTVFPLQKEKAHCDWLSMYRIFGDCQLHTATGRVSMSDPNLQNVPKDFEITMLDGVTDSVADNAAKESHQETIASKFSISMRHAFVPFEGGLLLAADYSQLELRMIAFLSSDPKLISVLNEDGDVFKLITAQWKNINPEEVTPQQRAQAKQICYGMIYGIGPKALGDQLEVDENDAAMFIETFKAKYPGMRSYLRRTVEECRKNGYVQTMLDRKRYLPHITSTNAHARAHAERQAVNTTVQGSAADLVKMAMIKIEEKLAEVFPHTQYTHRHKLPGRHPARTKTPPDGAYLVLQLHDELIYEVTASHSQTVAQIVKHCMENATALPVRMPVKVTVGPSWGKLAEFT